MTAGRGRGTDLLPFGKGLSELDSYFERSDNMAFVRKGLPVLTLTGL